MFVLLCDVTIENIIDGTTMKNKSLFFKCFISANKTVKSL